MNEDRSLEIRRHWLLAWALAWLAPVAHTADTVDSTTVLVGTCVACHGADGIGKAPQYPNLRGQKAPYMESQLKAFRSETRKGTDMNAIAKSLSDQDIAQVAAFFANME